MQSSSGISRRAVLGAIGTELIAAPLVRALPSLGKTAPPNVIFLLADDVGYGDLACLGNPVIKTPNLDKMHADSVRFTDFHVSPTCSPTRAALMTGRYCNETGVWHTIMGRSLVNPNEVTLADCFRSSGYRTGIYGKWHLGDNFPCRPHDRGFDDAVVAGGAGIWNTPDYFGNDDMDDTYLHNGKFQKYNGFSTDVFFNLAMDFISDAQNRGKPFFCYLATTAAHEPCWAKPEDMAPYEGVEGLSSPGFYGMVSNIDQNLGRLTRFLKDHNLYDNTIIFYAGDNGSWDGVGVYNASMRGRKGSAYDGGHRVPLFMSWPAGGLTDGRDIDVLTAHIDVLPTLVEICRLKEHGRNVDGTSLCPLLFGSGANWKPRTLVIDSQRKENLVKWKDTSVMTQRWRLVNPTENGDPNALELYDIVKDPGQKNNVAAAHPDVVRELVSKYNAWWTRASADGDKFVRIGLGNDAENPSYLNCMDWHNEDAEWVWNQREIRTAPSANGFWAVDVTVPGSYRFEMRRWPREVNLPINAPYTDPKPNREKTPGVAIAAVKARLMIADVDVSKPVGASDKFAAFTVSLKEGPTELWTAFYDADLDCRGAYYVYVERL